MKRTLIICSVLAIAGCGRMVDGTKDALNKGGELAGSAATEVIEGVATGVEDTWSINVVLSDDLKAHGLTVGKTQVEADSAGMDNQLIVYVSADKAFSRAVSAVATDEEGSEMGRSALQIDLTAGNADYFTFKFQARTDLERKSRVEIR